MLNATIEKLLYYATTHLDLAASDLTYKRNELLGMLNQPAPYLEVINASEIKALKVPDILINELREGIIAEGYFIGEDIQRLITEVMGKLTPLPSVVEEKFTRLYKQNRQKATEYLFNLSIYNDYIQKTKVEQNEFWTANFPENPIEITINLAKPEKDNKAIAAALKKEEELKYPQCLLCAENVGFIGHNGHPARQNLRTIPLKLDNENWFFQYSPYVYYDRHCIVIDEIHEPMAITPRYLSKLLAFVDQFPHFFIGSNSDLPIVGGSILNHEHFQGGAYLMPMMYAKPALTLKSRKFHAVNFTYLDWYNSTILLKSINKQQLLKATSYLLAQWKNYSDPSVDIVDHTGKETHNTLTAIARKVGNTYYMYVILRNNRCSETYPDGIFHAHPEHHPIKKEGIGLIEAMGLFILPARLKRQLAIIESIFVDDLNIDQALKSHPDIKIFNQLIEFLMQKPRESDFAGLIREYVNNTCRDILCNTAVFKNDEEGHAARDRFIKELQL